MYLTERDVERLVLISADETRNLSELEMLAETAGAKVLGQLTQPRSQPHPATYLGKGKLEELQAYASDLNATGILCDDELSSAQIGNLSKATGLKILDRSMIILDIFAERAMSAEGKAQVELAQLRYRLSRLAGLGAQLSRQGGTAAGGGVGGIGARGPGEKKLETDRRHIQSRIRQLNEELADISVNRSVLREKRLSSSVPVLALVGYTNAGKSTLMNALTSAGVLAEDKLFATLDTTTRKIELPGGTTALLTDTVGFIDKLPHHLIQAFRATLEELQYATILLHVVDVANPMYQEQVKVVQETLAELKCTDKPMINVYNKADLAPEFISNGQINISAKTGYHLPELLSTCEEVIQSMRRRMFLLVPYNKGHIVSLIHQNCEILTETHEEEGTKIEIFAPAELCGQLSSYNYAKAK